ncbi:uncharacterized protein [Chironomus tepperi]|uniref:uncharacterized protein n=1 Tax=Chironomus tepperi TaxID=113505 RepID=UPI00391F34B7
MSMFSNRFLWKASVYIAVGGMTCVMIMRSMLKERVRQTEYFRDSMKILRTHEGCKYLLGEPIKEVGLDVGEPNFANSTGAHFEVKVKGSQNKGTMYFWADRPTDKDKWQISRLELEIQNDDKRLVVVKSKDNQTELSE